MSARLTGVLLLGLWTAGTQAAVAPVTSLDQQIAQLRQQPDALVRYQAAKAAAWQAYARHEDSERSLTRLGQFAGQEAQRLVQGLSGTEPLSMVTPVPAGSGVMRRDLWATAELLKKHPAFAQVSEQVGESEVRLVWAAAEHCELGWRHSREHFAAAERLLQQARATAELMTGAPAWPESISYPSPETLNGSGKGCQGVQGAWPLVVPDFAVLSPPPQPVAPVALPIPAAQEVAVLPNVVHFALDRSELMPDSKMVLDRIVASLRKYPDMTVTLYGHTDYRASEAYNKALGERRAAAVEAYMVSQGIDLARMARVSKGKAEQKDDPNLHVATALSRRVEMVFVLDGVEIRPQPQTADLKIETDPPRP